MKTKVLGALLALLCVSCTKFENDLLEADASKLSGSEVSYQQAVLHTIKKGEHKTNKNTINLVKTSEVTFAARFDSSAIYRTKTTENQYDINKLYGFSDNNSRHHQYSARFGWRWSDQALRIFAYVYNDGVRQEKELGVIAIGAWVNCKIKVSGKQYIFSLNGVETIMPRASNTAKAAGYMLYPYFGGNETAPHDVRIWLKNL